MRSMFKIAGAAAAVLGLSATVAAAAPARTTADLNLRSGPGTNYNVVTSIPGGAAVDVGACQGSWCPVTYGSYEGYASGRYLEGGGAYGQPAPVATYVEPEIYEPSIYIAPPVYRSGRWWYNNRWYSRRPHYVYRPNNNNNGNNWNNAGINRRNPGQGWRQSGQQNQQAMRARQQGRLQQLRQSGTPRPIVQQRREQFQERRQERREVQNRGGGNREVFRPNNRGG